MRIFPPHSVTTNSVEANHSASVKKGRVPSTGEVFAVKFIHKQFAIERGRISLRQIHSEVMLHKHCGNHPNLIQFYDFGEDEIWTWIGMEFASGGDLFDKIGMSYSRFCIPSIFLAFRLMSLQEPDVGVTEDICHFYFTQLVAGMYYIHGQGVAHRGKYPLD